MGNSRAGYEKRALGNAIKKTIAYLKAENANNRHILFRPGPEIESFYLIADDINQKLLIKHHKYPNGKWKPGRMVV